MDTTEFETQYEGVLQTLEIAIVKVDIESDDLTDLEVLDALDSLIRAYTAEGNGYSAPFVRLSPLKRQVYDAVKDIAEWNMRRTKTEYLALESVAHDSGELAAPASDELTESDETSPPVTLDEIVACLKRIRLSVKRWNGSHGRRGYLEYVSKFLL